MRINWNTSNHRDGEVMHFRGAGFDIFVQDCDGDSFWWQIKDIRSGKIIASNGENGLSARHCLAQATAALRKEVRYRTRYLLSRAKQNWPTVNLSK